MPYKMKNKIKTTALVLLVSALTACIGPKGANKMEKQGYIEGIRDVTLNQLYKEVEGSKEELENAAGYAVFSNFKAKILWGGAASGHGIAVNNSTGKQVFMRMGEIQAGLGFGISDFRAVFIVKTQETFDQFITSGLDFSVGADATAQSDGKGSSNSIGSGDDKTSDPMIYRFTDSGIALSATINGTKYWVSPSLN